MDNLKKKIKRECSKILNCSPQELVKLFQQRKKPIAEIVRTAMSTRQEIKKRVLQTKEPICIMTDAEIKILKKYASQTRIMAVEIGTLYGGSAAYISSVLRGKVKLVTIDPFIYTIYSVVSLIAVLFNVTADFSIHDTSLPDCEGVPELAKFMVRTFGDINKIKIIKDYSYNVARKWKNKIDFLFLDGNHEYFEVLRDFIEWERFLVKGGIIIFHDSNHPLKNCSKKGIKKGTWGPSLLCKQIRNEMKNRYIVIDKKDSMTVFKKICE